MHSAAVAVREGGLHQAHPGAGTPWEQTPPAGPGTPRPGTHPPPPDQASPRTRHPPVDRHTPVNILPCLKLRLRAVKIGTLYIHSGCSMIILQVLPIVSSCTTSKALLEARQINPTASNTEDLFDISTGSNWKLTTKLLSVPQVIGFHICIVPEK